jgi:hypothetical protein
MRVKSNKALRRSARLARRACTSLTALPAVASFPRRPLIGAAVAAILYGGAGVAHAQQAQPAEAGPTSPTGESLQEVVVTATATGLKKLDASYNIVRVDSEAIKEQNPVSTADLLKVSPGIWPESSGGQTGANIEVAGFPSGGDAPFFTNMIEGLPLYGMPSLSFMDSSSLFRLDNTIDHVEVVQGGPAAVFSGGQMGATANFILRRGTATPTGEASVTYGDEGLWRTDLFSGFPIAPGWYGSVGGFYRTSYGVRDPQFPADQGGQLTGTISHDLDGGSLLIWGRVLDDKNQFIVPVPLQGGFGSNFTGVPGFDPLTGSYGSKAIQNVTIPNPAGGFQDADLANGRGGNLYYFGVKWEQKINDWQLSNNLLIDGGSLNTNALFSGPEPRPLSYYLYGCQMAQAAGFCNGATAVDTNNLGPGGQGLPLATNVSATYAGSGVAVPLSQSVIQQGWWYIQKSLQNVADEFRAGREIFAGNTLTGGAYVARYGDDDNWSLGNQMLMANMQNTRAITLHYVQAGQIYNLTSPQGFVNDNGNFNILAHGNATNIAGYLSDSWKVNQWLLDASVRLENINAHQRTCNRSNQALGDPVHDLWDNAVPICNGTWDFEHYVRTRPTFTVGANYEFTNYMSAYVRANNGVHFDDFDNGIRGNEGGLTSKTNTSFGSFAPLQTVENQEVGFKFQNAYAYVDVSAYHRTFTGLPYTPADITGTPIGPPTIYGAKAQGVDFIASVTPVQGFSVRVVGDYVDGTYTDNTNCFIATNINGTKSCAFINGDPLQRQPKFQVRVTPSYTTTVPWGDVSGWIGYEYVGQRYEDQSGLQPLGAYHMFDAGVLTDVGNNWQFRLQGTNLTNEIALTEGNARVFGQATGIGGILLARPIEGREVNLTAQYKW